MNWGGWVKGRGENMRNCPLTSSGVMVLYVQQTRQASIRKDTLKSGGFLFFRRAS